MFIQNSNGKIYDEIANIGCYSLLRDIKEDEYLHENEYVVAYNLKEYDDGYSWSQGDYFYNFIDAREHFLKKIGY